MITELKVFAGKYAKSGSMSLDDSAVEGGQPLTFEVPTCKRYQ